MNGDMTLTNYCCPLCDSQMIRKKGDSVDKNNGWTLYCPNLKCPAQEVSGHGKNIEIAYNIIMAKFTGRKLIMVGKDDDEEINPEAI